MPDPGMLDDYEKSGQIFETPAEHRVYTAGPGSPGIAEEKRKVAAKERYDAYCDDFGVPIIARINKSYHPDNAKKLIEVLDLTNNPLKRIVNEVSVLYARPPARTLSNSADTLNWRSLLKRAGAPVVFPRLNALVNLGNTCLLYVRPCGDSLTLRVVLPHDVTVVPDPDDPTMPFAARFCEYDPADPMAKPVYHEWDRRTATAGYRKYNHKGEEDESARLPNPYKDSTGRLVIPLIAFHREWPVGRFWDTTSGKDFYELTMMVGLWETWINYLIKTDSARQKYSTGPVSTEGEQVGGPENVLQFRPESAQGSVQVGEFSSQADWPGLGGQIKRKLDNVLGNVGLVLPDTRTSGDPTSGFALTVRSQGLRKIQTRQMPSYARSEETLYRVFAAVWNFERTNPAHKLRQAPALPPVEQAEPTIAFADVESMRTVEERKAEREIDEIDVRMGLASPITIYMRENPEATEDQAREAIAKNLEDTKALKPTPAVPPPQQTPPPHAGNSGSEDEQPADGAMADDEEMGMDAPHRR